MFYRLNRMLLNAQGAEGNGGGNNEPPPKEGGDKGPDLTKAIEGLLAKHGGQDGALRVLLAENYGLRDAQRELKAKLPADGSIVLAGDDVKAWEGYRGLGKPADLRAIVTEHGTFKGQLAGLQRDEELRAFADKDGVKVKFSVLKTLAGPKLDLTHTVKVKDPKTNKEAEVPAVKDGDAEPVAFDAYAAKHWADFLPALRADGKADAPAGPAVPPRRNAAPLPPVAQGGGASEAPAFRLPRI